MTTGSIACPWCCKSIEAAGLTAGSHVQCPRCQKAFTLRPEDLRAAAAVQAPAAPVPAVRAAGFAAPGVEGPRSASVWFAVAAAGGILLFLIAASVVAAALLSGRKSPQVAAARPAPAIAAQVAADAPPAAPADDAATEDPAPQDDAAPPPPHKPPPPKPPPVAAPPLRPSSLEPEPPAPSATDVDAALQGKADKAIARGVAFLKKQQQGDGSWIYLDGESRVGATALGGLALLECGEAPDEPHVAKAASFVRTRAPILKSDVETYEIGLAILFLDRLGDAKNETTIQRLALRLVAGQTPAGGWTYECPAIGPASADSLLAALRKTRPTSRLELIAPKSSRDPSAPAPPPAGELGGDADREAKQAVNRLTPSLRALPAFQPVPAGDAFPPFDVADNSCTQFAVLGLWTARRHDVPLERVLAFVDKRFRLSQVGDGGWGYNFSIPGVGSTGSMTAAGLLGLAVGHGVTADLKSDVGSKEASDDPAVENGMEALGRFIGGDPGGLGNIVGALLGADNGGAPSRLDLYFLWSVERVGVLYNRRTIGGKEWYPWAAQLLIDGQQPDGGWNDGGNFGIDSPLAASFALLVLKRANLTRDLSAKLEFLTQVKDRAPAPPPGDKKKDGP